MSIRKFEWEGIAINPPGRILKRKYYRYLFKILIN